MSSAEAPDVNAHKAQRRWRWRRRHSFILLASLTTLLYYSAEELLHLLLEGLHLLLESLEMWIEEFYEHVLHLPVHTAEILTVWTGAILALILLYFTGRAIVRRIVRAYIATRNWCLKTLAAFHAWRRALSEADIAILIVIGCVVVFMLLSLL